MNNQTSAGMQMHICTVDKVYGSGMLDVTSSRGRRFEYVNIMFLGAEDSYQEGDQCILISDGAQKVVLGKMRNPKVNDQGEMSIKNAKSDLAELEGAKILESSDEFGNQGKVVALPSGVIIDSGGGAVTHMDAERSVKTDLSERYEQVTIPHHQELSFDDGVCSSTYHWRSRVDYDAFEEAVNRTPPKGGTKGNSLSVNITDGENFIEIKVLKDGKVKNVVHIKEDGSVNIDMRDASLDVNTGSSSLEFDELSVSGGDVDVDGSNLSISSSGKIEMKAEGKVEIESTFGGVSIKGRGVDIADIVGAVVDSLALCTTVTPLGTYPLLNAPVKTIIDPQLSAFKGI